jgi:hypothetical protein
MSENKPPMGIVPELVFEQQRCEALAEAILRYVYFANYQTAPDNIYIWTQELLDRISSMRLRGLTQYALDGASALSAEQDTHSESVPAGEADTQPRK